MKNNFFVTEYETIELTSDEYVSIEAGSVFSQLGEWTGWFLEELQYGDHRSFMKHNISVGVPI